MALLLHTKETRPHVSAAHTTTHMLKLSRGDVSRPHGRHIPAHMGTGRTVRVCERANEHACEGLVEHTSKSAFVPTIPSTTSCEQSVCVLFFGLRVLVLKTHVYI